MPANLLIAEDEDHLRQLFEMLLGDAGFNISLAQDGAVAWEMFCQSPPDVVLTDLRMPNLDGLGLLRKIKKARPDIPVLVITAYGDIGNSVEAMKAGATDFLTKPIDEEQLKLVLQKALNWRALVSENQRLRAEKIGPYNFSNMVAESDEMKQMMDLAAQVAQSDTTVLIYGESGTGKELLARAIHVNSPRSKEAFEPVNCAAIPDQLLESELFGYERGAFTGAVDAKPGLFELASDGTLFLDEIGDMAFPLQAKLLRALEDGTFRRLGGSKTIQSNTRFVVATNRNIAEMVRNGEFREDLFYRIAVFPLAISPLRERRDDILPLAKHFLKRYCRQMGKPVPEIDKGGLEALMSHTWPGNVRELQNAIERAVILLASNVMGADLLDGGRFGAPEITLDPQKGGARFTLPGKGFNLDQHTRDLICQALDRSKGNKSAAAEMLGISRATLRYRIDKYDLESESGDEKDL